MGLLSGVALGPLAVAVAIFLLLVDLMHRRRCWAARYPPGPVRMPLLGNLLQMDFQNALCYFDQLRQRFGNVFTLYLAWTPFVVLNGLDAVREALVYHSEDTADRPPMPIYEHLGFKQYSQGVILARYGREWREQRRFSLSALRNFGLGKKSLEQWVTEEASSLCDAFADYTGRPFSPRALLDKAVSNVISSLTFGRRFEYDDPRLLKLLDRLHAGLEEDQGLLREVLNAIPVLLHIPGLAGKLFSAQKAFMTLIDELVREHRTSRDPTQPPRDLTDAFLDEVEKAKGNPKSSFNDENLSMVTSDLFVAGMVSTSTTLTWALLLMILHPDVQHEPTLGARWAGRGRRGTGWGLLNMICNTPHPRPTEALSRGWALVGGRVQQEIDEVIGQARQPEMGDQAHMPFTMAVVHEVQRYADIVPLGVPHMTTRDIKVQGFLIPKGTRLITNLSSVLKDKTAWKKPFRFDPEHFLDAEGRFVKQEAFMPFSAGRRVCLGEPLARMELFLFFTRLLQRFDFSVPPGQPRPSDHGTFSFLVTPAPYQLCAVPR